jgi:hypothetical protein
MTSHQHPSDPASTATMPFVSAGVKLPTCSAGLKFPTRPGCGTVPPIFASHPRRGPVRSRSRSPTSPTSCTPGSISCSHRRWSLRALHRSEESRKGQRGARVGRPGRVPRRGRRLWSGPRRPEDATARLAAWSIAYENLPSSRRSVSIRPVVTERYVPENPASVFEVELRGSDSNRRPLGYEFNPLRPRSSLLVPDRARLYSSRPSLVPSRPFWSLPVPGRL